MMNKSERAPSFLWLFLGHVVLLAVTIVVVWMVYAYLHAYQLGWLGWFYAKLLPLTNGFCAFVEAYFPNDVEYKIRAAISDFVIEVSISNAGVRAIAPLTRSRQVASSVQSGSLRRLTPNYSTEVIFCGDFIGGCERLGLKQL